MALPFIHERQRQIVKKFHASHKKHGQKGCYSVLFLIFAGVKTRGCPISPSGTGGLRSYSMNLMRFVPPKGLFILPPLAVSGTKKQPFVFTCKTL